MNEKPIRGRPKTLNRDQVLQEAMMAYWSKGPTNVSISDICGMTGTSKPGVYREFGNDDGLKLSVLDLYHSLVIQQLSDLLEKDQPTTDTIRALIDFMTQDCSDLNIPKGCLFVMMRAHTQQLGSMTCDKLDEIQHTLLGTYASWIERSKSRGEFADIPTNITALFIDAQHGSAMRMQTEGVPNEIIANVLWVAFRNLGLNDPSVKHSATF